MEMNSKQRKFILLRADGLSFDKIATKLKTSKTTLIQWSKLFEEKIEEIQFEAFIEIKEAFSWNKKSKYKTLLQQLEKIDNAILETDITKENLKDLFQIKNSIVAQLENIEKKVTTNAHITQTDEFGNKEQLRLNLNEVE